MAVLWFTNCARKRVVVVCTQSRLAMFQGRVFSTDPGDVADICALEKLKPDEMPKTHVVVLMNGEWEHWVAHMHFFLMLEEENSRHFLLRLRWNLHNKIFQAVMKLQRWWRFTRICDRLNQIFSLRRASSAHASRATVSCCFLSVAAAQHQQKQQLPSILRSHPKRQ